MKYELFMITNSSF